MFPFGPAAFEKAPNEFIESAYKKWQSGHEMPPVLHLFMDYEDKHSEISFDNKTFKLHILDTIQ